MSLAPGGSFFFHAGQVMADVFVLCCWSVLPACLTHAFLMADSVVSRSPEVL